MPQSLTRQTPRVMQKHFLPGIHTHTHSQRHTLAHTLDKQQNAKGNALENLNKNRVGAENALTAEGGVSTGGVEWPGGRVR